MDITPQKISLEVLMTELKNMGEKNEDIRKSVERLDHNVKESLRRIEEKMEEKYATKFEVNTAIEMLKTDINPIKNVIYGLVGIILVAFMGAVFALVFK